MEQLLRQCKRLVALSFAVFVIFGLIFSWDQQKDFSKYPSMKIQSFNSYQQYEELSQTSGKTSVTIDEANRKEIWVKLASKLQQQEKAKHLPKIILIGAKKCGTEALIYFMVKHPLVKRGGGEVHFFDKVTASENDTQKYLDLFKPVEEGAFLMEKTPGYFRSAKMNIAQRMKKTVPNAKLLVVLCEPSKRALSDYFHHKAKCNQNYEKCSNISRYPTIDDYLKTYYPIFKEKLKGFKADWSSGQHIQMQKDLLDLSDHDPITGILTNGLYILMLKEWFEYFNESNFLILNGEEMYRNIGEVVERIQDFVGLPKVLLKSDFVKNPETGFYCFKNWIKNNTLDCLPSIKRRTRNGNQNLPESSHKQLKDLYEPFNQALFKFIGRIYEW